MTVLIEIKVPDVGNVAEIDVVEVLIQAGDVVALEQTVAVLETDKASMELPSSASGTVQQVYIKPGDKVSEGSLIATVLVNAEAASTAPAVEPVAAPVEVAPVVEAKASPPAVVKSAVPAVAVTQIDSSVKTAHASPSVRLFARELGVDISKIKTGSGRKGRILKEDVKQFVKKLMEEGAVATGAGIPSIPAVDFSVFGEIETQKLKNPPQVFPAFQRWIFQYLAR